MFGEDMPWYAEGVVNQHSRVVNDQQRRRHYSRVVSSVSGPRQTTLVSSTINWPGTPGMIAPAVLRSLP